MAALDATVVGISSQSLDSHERFRDHHDLTVPLLADEDRAVAKAYGVSVPVVGARRAVFVIDAEGVVRHRHVHSLGLGYQDVDALREALASA
jgi:peroxiredoxin Q/BCP